MVELKGLKYGLDLNGARVCIVGRNYSAGRELVNSIVETDSENMDNSLIQSEAGLYFSVSEKEAIIKRIKTGDDMLHDPDKTAQFELASSLLDDSESYYYETFPLNGIPERLTVAYNKKTIDDRVSFLDSKFGKPSGFKLRSMAMAGAYLNFCQHEGGQLICLVDMYGTRASYCFLKGGLPIFLGAVSEDVDHNETTKAFLLDVISTLQYQLSILEKNEGALPLSLIVITGMSASENLAAEIEQISGVKTVLPSVRKELFAGNIVHKAAKYLVSLGLTINN